MLAGCGSSTPEVFTVSPFADSALGAVTALVELSGLEDVRNLPPPPLDLEEIKEYVRRLPDVAICRLVLPTSRANMKVGSNLTLEPGLTNSVTGVTCDSAESDFDELDLVVRRNSFWDFYSQQDGKESLLYTTISTELELP